MSKKIKADMGKLEEIQTILETNAKKITHNITRITNSSLYCGQLQ